MIAESVEGEIVSHRSRRIAAWVIRNADGPVAGGRVRGALHRRPGTRRTTDEAALSPTTSVILMVAITVGLAILLYFMVLWTTPGH
jgi:hypothetical protein